MAFNFHVNTLNETLSCFTQMDRDNRLSLNRRYVSLDPDTNIDMMFPIKKFAPLNCV